MSKRIPRNIQLLSQISDGNQFKKTLAPRVFDVGLDFERDMEALGLNRNWSPEGRRNEAQKIIRSALRDLRDVRRQVDEYRAATEAMRAKAKLPAFDKADIVGAMNRRELRDRSVAMTSGQRAGLMSGKTRSAAFLDAIFEFPDDAWMAGINIHEPGEREIYEAAKSERLRDLHAPLLDAIAARETIESEALMVVNVVRGDVAADCGLEPQEFAAEVKHVETGINAHWLRKDKDANGNERTIVIDVENHRSRVATPDEIRDGVFFKDHAEYLASRAA